MTKIFPYLKQNKKKFQVLNARICADLVYLGWVFWLMVAGFLAISYLNISKYGLIYGLAYLPTLALLFAYRIGYVFFPKVRAQTIAWNEVISWVTFICVNGLIFSLVQNFPLEECLRNAPFLMALLITGSLSLFSSIAFITAKVALMFGLELMFMSFLGHNILNEYFTQAAIGGIFALAIAVFFYLLRAFQCYIELTASESLIHAYGQLKKLVLPHQLEMSRSGYNLEETMPIGSGEAGVICFDIQNSSSLAPGQLTQVMEGLEVKVKSILYESYSQNPLASNGYLINAMGDGLMCSVGYPLPYPEDRDLRSATLELAIRLTNAFKEVTNDMQLDRELWCSIGASYGELSSFYSNYGTLRFDLYGNTIVRATRYQDFRKVLKELIQSEGHYLVVDSVLVRDDIAATFQLQRFDLSEHNIRVRNDSSKDELYFVVDNNSSLEDYESIKKIETALKTH